MMLVYSSGTAGSVSPVSRAQTVRSQGGALRRACADVAGFAVPRRAKKETRRCPLVRRRMGKSARRNHGAGSPAYVERARRRAAVVVGRGAVAMSGLD